MREQSSDRKTSPPIRLLRISEVAARTGLSRSTIYEWSADGRFPAPVRLGGRLARWVESEVEEWLRKWLEKRRGAEAPAATRNRTPKEERA